MGSTLAAVVNLWPLAVFGGGVTVVLSALLRGSAGVTGAAAGVLVAMYFVEVLGRISDAMSGVAHLSAFHYYGSAIEDGLDPAACLGLTAAGHRAGRCRLPVLRTAGSPPVTREEPMTKQNARAGDWIEIDAIGGGPHRTGQIIEVLGAEGHEHFRVRWDEQHESLHFPAQGTRVLREDADGNLESIGALS